MQIGNLLMTWGWVFGLALVVLGFILWRIKQAPPKCSCGQQTVLVDPKQKHNHLSKVQRMEQKLEHVVHRVFRCPGCKAVQVKSRVRHKKAQCPKCAHYTLETTDDLMREANRQREGLRRFTTRCRAPECHYQSEKDVAVAREVKSWIPAARKPHSGHGGGGSGESSGRSSGGGAGADW